MQGPKPEPSYPWVARTADVRGAGIPTSPRASWTVQDEKNSSSMGGSPLCWGETQLGLGGGWETPPPNPKILALWLGRDYPCPQSWPPAGPDIKPVAFVCVKGGMSRLLDHVQALHHLPQPPPPGPHSCRACFASADVLALCVAVAMETIVL